MTPSPSRRNPRPDARPRRLPPPAIALLVLALLLPTATAQDTQAPPPPGGAAPAAAGAGGSSAAVPASESGAGAALDFAAVLEAARQGPSVRLATLALRQAEATLAAASGAVSATVQAGYSHDWGTLSGSDVSGGALDPVTLDAQLNVVPFGPAWDTRTGAQRDVERARLALADATRTATLDAATAYLAALRAQRQVALDDRAVALAQAAQGHVEAQAAAGDASAAAVLAARLATSQAQTTRTDDTLELQAQLATLGDLLGGPVAAVAGEPPPSSDPDTSDLPDAIERRSDVRSAALALDDARAKQAAAVRGALPAATVAAGLRGGDGTTGWSAGLSYGTTSYQPNVSASVTPGGATSAPAQDGTVLTLSLGVKVSLDSALPAALDTTRLATEASATRLDQAREAAQLAILNAQRTLQTRTAAAALAAQQRDQRTALLDEARQRLALGLVAAPDVDQAALDLDRAELALRQAQDAVLTARMTLAVALGLDPMEVL